MPELPEIYALAARLDEVMTDEVIERAEVRQEKCLNLPVARFTDCVAGARVTGITPRGKWIFVHLTQGRKLLLNLGMGADVRWDERLEEPQIELVFRSGSSLCLKFWWFGHAHLVDDDARSQHPGTAGLGPDALDDDLTEEEFLRLLSRRRGQIKPLLQNQKFIAGIGNVYVQDMLFSAGIHPRSRVPDIPREKLRVLYHSMRKQLADAVSLSGVVYERDIYGNPGNLEEFMVAYREGEECPRCGAAVHKEKVGSAAAYFCPGCQRLHR